MVLYTVCVTIVTSQTVGFTYSTPRGERKIKLLKKSLSLAQKTSQQRSTTTCMRL